MAAFVPAFLVLLVTGAYASGMVIPDNSFGAPGSNHPLFAPGEMLRDSSTNSGILPEPAGAVLLIPVEKTEPPSADGGETFGYRTGPVRIVSHTLPGIQIPEAAFPEDGNMSPSFEVLDDQDNVLYYARFAFQTLITVPMQSPEKDRDGIPPVLQVTPRTLLVVPLFNGAKKIRITDEYGRFRDLAVPAGTEVPDLINGTGAALPSQASSGEGSLDILILASGYSAATISRFSNQADLAKEQILGTEPFSSYGPAVQVNSYPTSGDLGCYTGCYGIDRLMCCDSTKVLAAAEASGFPYDEIIVIHNTPVYAGGGYREGGTMAYRTNSYSTYCQVYDGMYTIPMIMHELGHSIGDLCDEYSYGSEGYSYTPCVNCRASCSDLSQYSGICTIGCDARSSYFRPERSIMLDLQSPAVYNQPSLRAEYAPDGLYKRLDFFSLQSPVAAFTATPRSGTAPLTVQFTDMSANKPASWKWLFGDASAINSTRRNPWHTFTRTGIYSVTLNATNSLGSNKTTKTRYIRVLSPITVVQPDGGQNWRQGTNQTIRWNYTGSPGPAVRIDLIGGPSVARVIAAHVPVGSRGSGVLRWKVPFNQTPDGGYRIRILSETNTSYVDASNASFTISAGAPVTVTAPNGGEIWAAGTVRNITWSYTGDSESNVTIRLVRGMTVNQVILESTSIGSGGSGSYTWELAAEQIPATDYRIRITSTGNSGLTDISNGNFTITG